VRLREWQGADRVALAAWWKAQSAVLEALRQRDRALAAGVREQQRIAGGITARQRTWAQRATTGSGRPVGESARRRQLRLSQVEPRLVEARDRHQRLLAESESTLVLARRTLDEATGL
jgi:hypothetical protein